MEENNNVNNIKKKKPILSIVSLTILAVLVLVGTYAYWQVTEKQTNRNLVGSACLSITFSNETGDIDLENMWPTSDADGSALVPYTFTLTNTCPDELVAYTVAIEEIKDDSENPITYPTDYLSDTNLKIKFDNLAPVKISTLDNIPDDTEQDYEIYKTKKIINRKLAGGESRTHSVRMWLDANAPETEMNKFFLSKIKIIAGQGIEEECYAVNSDGLLYAYDPDCGTSATIPATVDGKQVKEISSTAFKGERTTTVPNINIYDYELYDEKDGDQAKPNAKINSINDFRDLNNTCDSRTNAQCEVDYSIAMTSEFGSIIQRIWDGEWATVMQDYNVESEEELISYINDHFSEDDMFVVIYYDGSDTDKLNAIRTQAAQSDYFNVANALGWDINYYNEGSKPTPAGGLYEYYYSLSYYSGDGYSDRDLGWSEPGEGTSTVTVSGLMVDSLDLSEATYLEKIDSIAFSNVPTLNQSNFNTIDPSSVPVGIKSLTFGVHSHDIDLGGCAFCRSQLSELTIYSNIQLDDEVEVDLDNASNAPDNLLYYLYGAFGFSNIGTINVLKAGNDTTIDTPKMSITDNTTGNKHYQGLGIINGGATGETTVNSVTIGAGIETLEDGAFRGLNPQTLSLPSSLVTIGSDAFWAYNGTTLTIPSNVVTIGEEAFRQYQGSGQSLVIPASVRTIEEGAFYRYVGSSLTINEGVTKIGRAAFQQYNGANFTLPASVTDLGAYKNEDSRGSVWAFFPGTINVNRTQADFEANVTRPSDWNLRGTTHFLDS